MNLEDLNLRELVGLNRMIQDMRAKRALDAPFKWHGSIEHLTESDIKTLENMYNFLHSQHTNIEQNYGSLENARIEDLIGTENMNKLMSEQYAVSGGNESGIKGNYESGILDGSISSTEAMVAKQRFEHAVSGGNDSSIKGNYEDEILNGGIENTEARINMQRTMHAVSGGNDSEIRGNRESEDLDFAAKERAHRMNGYNNNPIEQHYGSAENMTTDNLDQLAASNKAVNLEQNSRAGRYDGAVGGTMEDAIASGDGLNHLEAARASQIAESRPHINSLQALLINPHGFDPDSFKIIVSNGLKNNQILKNFMENFRERLAEQVELIANTPTTPEELITRNNLMDNKFFQNSEELANLSTESIRSKAKSTVEAYLNIYAHLRHEIKAQNGVIDQNYITISEDMISRIFDAQKVLGREKLSQLIMMPTPLKTHSQYNVGDFISPAVAALYSLDPEMRQNGVGLNINTDVYKNPKSQRWKEPSMEEGM